MRELFGFCSADGIALGTALRSLKKLSVWGAIVPVYMPRQKGQKANNSRVRILKIIFRSLKTILL